MMDHIGPDMLTFANAGAKLRIIGSFIVTVLSETAVFLLCLQVFISTPLVKYHGQIG
ncbi:hypothetical protein SDC9_147456 [bioreactor metagenome]|uniref:Uncharacterized protein n=1 Tax=bioreactor metagenome TaxID=1076179 RepID=A0A645EG49_9ZZZZ